MCLHVSCGITKLSLLFCARGVQLFSCKRGIIIIIIFNMFPINSMKGTTSFHT